MKKETESRIYVGITCFCMAMCALFITPVIKGGETAEKHEEIQMNEVSIVEKEKKDIFLNEDYFSSKLSDYLPEQFPSDGVQVEISGSSEIHMGCTVERKNIENMVKDQIGFKEKLLLKLLPSSFSIDMYFKASADRENGMLVLDCDRVNIHGMDMDSSIIPGEITELLEEGFNKILLDSGFYYTDMEIKNGGIQLLP